MALTYSFSNPTAVTRAILLCAGRGLRLDPLTRDRPKCLVEVAGMPILDYQLAALRSAGVAEVVVVAGYRHECVRNHLDNRRIGPAVRMAVNPHWRDSDSIGSVRAVAELLDRPFLLANGDTIFSTAVVRRALSGSTEGVNLVVERAAPEPDDMRVAISEGRIRGVSKDIQYADFRSLGPIVSRECDGQSYRGALDEVLAEPGGERRHHHAVIDRLARRQSVDMISVTGMAWQEIDTPADVSTWNARNAQFGT